VRRRGERESHRQGERDDHSRKKKTRIRPPAYVLKKRRRGEEQGIQNLRGILAPAGTNNSRKGPERGASNEQNCLIGQRRRDQDKEKKENHPAVEHSRRRRPSTLKKKSLLLRRWPYRDLIRAFPSKENRHSQKGSFGKKRKKIARTSRGGGKKDAGGPIFIAKV